MTGEDEIDTSGTDAIICPYCGEEFGDSWEFNGSDGSKVECHECENVFLLEVDFDVSYTTIRINVSTEKGTPDAED